MSSIILAVLVGFILGFGVVTALDEVCVVRTDEETNLMTVSHKHKIYRLVRLEISEEGAK